MFKQLKPLLLIHRDLQRISNCLEFLVRQEARKAGIIWNNGQRAQADDGLEPELFHTDPAEIAILRQREQERFAARGDEEENG